jgi:hypothetical protein
MDGTELLCQGCLVTQILVSDYHFGKYGGEITIMQLFIGAVAVVGIVVLWILAIKAREWMRNRQK